MNMKPEIVEVNAQLRGELEEHGDMDYETMSRIVGEHDDALNERAAALDRRAAVLDERAEALDARAAALDERDDVLELDGDKTAHPLFGRSPARNRVHTNGLNDRDLLTIKNAFEFLSRSTENVALHIETRADGTTVDVRRLDSVEPQPITPHSQPASKEGNAVAKEKAQSGNSVKDRISGLMDKIKDGSQIGSNVVKILEFLQAISPMGLSILGGS